jgi:hypothetical protein
MTADSSSGLGGCSGAGCARTCVFTTGGTITLASQIRVQKPNLTVAGQTAPGGGIQIRGPGLAAASLISLDASATNVILRYLRVRPGHGPTPGSTNTAIALWGGTGGVVLDHISTAWDHDKSVSGGYGTANATIGWSLFAEALQSSTGFLSMHSSSAQASAQRNYDIHHSIWTTVDHRVPMYQGQRLRWINNYAFNFRYSGLSDGSIQLDVIGSVWKRGNIPLATGSNNGGPGPLGGLAPAWRWERYAETGNNEPNVGGTNPSIYAVNNVGPNNPDGSLDNYSTLFCQSNASDPSTNENGPCQAAMDPAYRRTASLEAAGIEAPAFPVQRTALAVPGDGSDLRALLVADAGANKSVTCDGRWIANRDGLDSCILGYVSNPASAPGSVPRDETASICAQSGAVAPWPTLAAGSRCEDADGNRLPDAWELRVCGGAGCAGSANGTSVCGSGWTNLECWMNGMK